jgi:sugar phosphate isomerase/epimerase
MKTHFLSFVVCLFVATLTSFELKNDAKTTQKLFPKKLGVVSYTYRKSFEKNVAATLDTIKSLGVKDMEFSSLFGKTAQELRNLLDERGMKCSSFGAGYPDFKDKIDEVAQKAKALGADYVRVAWIPHEGAFTLDLAKKTVEDFNKFGEILKNKYGLTFCYHNHGYEFEKYENGTLFDYIVQNTKPEYVSFEMDIMWVFFPGADPAALLDKYGNRFKLMHLKDLKKGVVGNLSGGTPQENSVALGTGQLDMPAIMKAAKKAKIKHYYIEDESEAIRTQVPQSIQFLSNF